MTQNNLMPTIGATAITALIAYLLGSISFAIIVSKVYAHDDVRKYGSKNAGMTNILRTYGKLPAFFTLLGDFLKGVLAVVIGRWIFSAMGITAFDAGYVAGFFALLGHLYPVYFGFKGGKGVLTSLGIILVVITGALLYPVITLVVDLCLRKPALFDVLFAALFSVIVIYKHKDNIRRLLNGTEKRIGDKKPVTQPESRKEEKN